jgi:hypothetical protein
MKHLRKLEESLLVHEVRVNHSKLNELIHESFVEIGYSGKTYTKTDILSELSNKSEPSFICWSQDYNFITLSSTLIIVMYKEARMNNDGKLSRHAKRTSIWFSNGEVWQLKFHQGTPTKEFEKLSN